MNMFVNQFSNRQSSPLLSGRPCVMMRASLIILIVIAGSASLWAQQSSGGAAEIIRSMEQRMYPDARTEMHLVSVSRGVREEYRLTSFARDNNQRIIVRFHEPASMVGQDLLMLDRNVWLYDPRAGREMRIPSNQSFGGTGFSYGDVLRLNFSDNYSAAIAGETASQWTLELTALRRDAPYERITLEVTRDFNPVRGRCYSRAGELVKEMVYSNPAAVSGTVKPLTVTVSSPLDPAETSTLTIVSEQRTSYPQSIFNRRNLALRLEENY